MRSKYNRGQGVIKTYKLVIPGKLPGLNDYIKAERGNRYAAAGMKADAEYLIAWKIREQLKGLKIRNKVSIDYLWVEQNRKRDKDNVAFAKKFIQDALVKTRVIENDGWANIDSFTDRFIVDKCNPRIEVTIKEVG